MKRGYLTDYVKGVAGKRLAAVETIGERSNQHEIHGVDGLAELLGEPEGRQRYSARFVYVSDTSDTSLLDEGTLTWYDARRKAREERRIMRWERRLYYTPNRPFERGQEGDGLFIVLLPNHTLLCILVAAGSTTEAQLLWLFGLPHLGDQVEVAHDFTKDVRGLSWSVVSLLELLGIEVDDRDDTDLELVLRLNKGNFPKTRQLSGLAREIAAAPNPLDDPDGALLAWFETEHRLFRLMERHDVSARLREGFIHPNQDVDVDGFLQYSLSVQNRRKSRAGYALENHFEAVLQAWNIPYTRAPVTEGQNRPDFILPGIEHYRDPTYPDRGLRMVACKSSCKERWRQILTEANRIWPKHLLTLDVAISANQLDEIKRENVHLTIPTAQPSPSNLRNLLGDLIGINR
jgi:hypothetical protein